MNPLAFYKIMESKRKRRTSKEIEESIQKAAIQIIEKDGFSHITVRGIIQKAKIQAAVFYNRYKDLDHFISEFVKSYDYWFDDVIKDCEDIKDQQQQYISLLVNLFHSLQDNKIMQQLLKWEITTNNSTTRQTAKLREFYSLPLVEKYKKYFENSPVKIDAVSALVIGGIYYFILHAEVSLFGGIDVETEEGKKKITNAIEYLGDLFFSDASPESKTFTIARRMKERGIPFSTIADCTGLTGDVIRQL